MADVPTPPPSPWWSAFFEDPDQDRVPDAAPPGEEPEPEPEPEPPPADDRLRSAIGARAAAARSGSAAAAAAAADTQTQSVTVPQGAPYAVLRVVGAEGPPELRIEGPGGFRFETPEDRSPLVGERRAVRFVQAPGNVTGCRS